MNKKKLILIRGGLLFASSLPLIAASCKNNETKEPKKEPEMDAAKTGVRGKFIAIKVFLKKEEKSQKKINHLNELEE